jgi:hypothetical protein
MTIIKDLSKSSDNGSNSSNGGGSGNNSDNSALVSLGNTSFGFNFDSEEGNKSPRSSNNSEEGDSDGNSNFQSNQNARGGKPKLADTAKTNQAQAIAVNPAAKISSDSSTMARSSHNDAAAAAAANLQSIATACLNKTTETGEFYDIYTECSYLVGIDTETDGF